MNSKDLAKLIGVSQSTVSRALNGSPQISEKRRKEIIQFAKDNHFEFNVHAKNLRSQTSNFIGILMPVYFRSFIEDDFRTAQFNYMYQTLSRLGYDPVLLSEESLSDDADALDRLVRKRQLAGLILGRRIENDDVIAYLKGLSIPLVSMTRCNEKMQFIPSVCCDSYEMGRLVGEHFANRGFRNVACIRVKKHDSGDITKKGFQDALAAHGVSFSEDNIIYAANFGFRACYDAICENLQKIRTFEALYMQNNDTMALGAISALQDHCICVPGQIAVVGNNDIPVAQWFAPHLTTVRTFVEVHSRLTCERIVSMIRSGKDSIEQLHYVLKPELVIRESSP